MTRLIATRCAICGTEGNSKLLYPANFDFAALNPATFSARRLPDGIRFQMVKCRTCGLVRSDPIADPDAMARLYTQSEFTYEREVDNLEATYSRHLAEVLALGGGRDALLEIGCGPGFLLLEAVKRGFADVRGIEPSAHAIDRAHADIRPRIVRDVMRPGLFAPETFDVICMFQVFDHIPQPGELLDECWRLLKPDGVVLTVNHNVESVSARLLKARSPIVDIEHTFLFSPATMVQIFAVHGFTPVRVGAVRNRTNLRALARLAPLPVGKRPLVERLERSSVGSIAFTAPLGNLRLIARKSPRAAGSGALLPAAAWQDMRILPESAAPRSSGDDGDLAGNGTSAGEAVSALRPAPDRRRATTALSRTTTPSEPALP